MRVGYKKFSRIYRIEVKQKSVINEKYITQTNIILMILIDGNMTGKHKYINTGMTK